VSELRRRLERLLLLVPRVAGVKQGVPVEALAASLGLSVEALQEELDFLLLVGRPPFSPADFLDIYIEDERVFAPLTLSLDRPPRFTHDEVLALAVGIDALSSGADPSFGEALREILKIIEEAMSPSQRERYLKLRERVVMAGTQAGARADLHRVIREAIEERRIISVQYYSAQRESFGERKLLPYGLLAHQGYWYLAAADATAAGEQIEPAADQRSEGFKLFRLDRVAEAEALGEAGVFEIPPDLGLEKLRPGRFLQMAGDELPRLRIGAAKARFAAEQIGEGQSELQADGALLVSFPTATWEWVSGWAMAYAPEVEILGPKGLIQRYQADLERSLALYQE